MSALREHEPGTTRGAVFLDCGFGMLSYVFSVLPASRWHEHGREADRRVVVAFWCDRLPFRRQNAGYVYSVAQICNLLYRRIAFCGTSASASAVELSDALPITNRRYGRLQICATRPLSALNKYNAGGTLTRNRPSQPSRGATGESPEPAGWTHTSCV
jgi:hypothetical protein